MKNIFIPDEEPFKSSGASLQKSPPEKNTYAETDELRQFLEQLRGKKFKLDCGHHVTFGHFLGNDITIRNGKIFKIICSECGY